MKKKDIKLELYVAQQQVLELNEQIERLSDQGDLIKALFDKIRELREEKEFWMKKSTSTSEEETGPIDLQKVEAAL